MDDLPHQRSILLLFFAKSRELAGRTEAHLLISCTNEQIVCRDLLHQICVEHNLCSIESSVILAINDEYCSNLEELIDLSTVNEVAIIPPISGG